MPIGQAMEWLVYSRTLTLSMLTIIWDLSLPIPSATMATVRSRGSPADVSKPLFSYRARHGRVYGTLTQHERKRAEQEMARDS